MSLAKGRMIKSWSSRFEAGFRKGFMPCCAKKGMDPRTDQGKPPRLYKRRSSRTDRHSRPWEPSSENWTPPSTDENCRPFRRRNIARQCEWIPLSGSKVVPLKTEPIVPNSSSSEDSRRTCSGRDEPLARPGVRGERDGRRTIHELREPDNVRRTREAARPYQQ